MLLNKFYKKDIHNYILYQTMTLLMKLNKHTQKRKLTNLKKILKTALCSVEQHDGLSEGIALFLSGVTSPGNVFSEVIFLWICVFLCPFHDLKQGCLKSLWGQQDGLAGIGSAIRPEDLSFIPRIHMVKEEQTPPSFPLTFKYILWHRNRCKLNKCSKNKITNIYWYY